MRVVDNLQLQIKLQKICTHQLDEKMLEYFSSNVDFCMLYGLCATLEIPRECNFSQGYLLMLSTSDVVCIYWPKRSSHIVLFTTENEKLLTKIKIIKMSWSYLHSEKWGMMQVLNFFIFFHLFHCWQGHILGLTRFLYRRLTWWGPAIPIFLRWHFKFFVIVIQFSICFWCWMLSLK